MAHLKGWLNFGQVASSLANRPTNYNRRVTVSRDQEKLYGYDRSALADKMRVATAPFTGSARNMNPRVPEPYVAPKPRGAERIDWKGTTSEIFRQPEFKKAYKRIHQMVYGTPQAQARRGGLSVDWGSAHMKGYPIHQGRTQNWLPSVMPSAVQAQHSKDIPLSHHKTLSSHYNIGDTLYQRQYKSDGGHDWTGSGRTVKWSGPSS